jgi:hypothetical protein
VTLEVIDPDNSLLVTLILDLNKLWLEAIQNLFIGRMNQGTPAETIW